MHTKCESFYFQRRTKLEQLNANLADLQTKIDSVKGDIEKAKIGREVLFIYLFIFVDILLTYFLSLKHLYSSKFSFYSFRNIGNFVITLKLNVKILSCTWELFIITVMFYFKFYGSFRFNFEGEKASLSVVTILTAIVHIVEMILIWYLLWSWTNE